METESLNWFKLSRCIFTEGTEILHKLFTFISETCFVDYHKLWLAKTYFHGRSNDLKVLRNSFDQQFMALDTSSQQVLQSLLAKWKRSCRATPVDIRTQLSILNEWGYCVHEFLNIHVTQKDTLKKCYCEIQSLERVNTSLLTLINNWTLVSVNLCQADQLDLVRLIEWHHECTGICSAAFLHELEFCIRMWRGELHTILNTFQQQEVNFDHQLQKELKPFSLSLHPKIEQLLDLRISFILNSPPMHILQTFITNARNILPEKHEMCPTGLQNIYNLWSTNLSNMSSEWGNLLQQVSASTTDIHDLILTRQTYIQAFSLASEQQRRRCFYSDRRFGLNIKSGLIITDPKRSSMYQTHGYSDLRKFYLTLFSTLHRNLFPICPPELGWNGEIVEANHSKWTDLMRLKKFGNDYFGHIPAPTLTIDEFENLWTIIDASIHIVSKATDEKIKENTNQKPTELKTCPFGFNGDINIKLKLIHSNQCDKLFLERSTDEKVEISLSHVQTIYDKIQTLYQDKAFKKTTDHMKERMERMEKSMNRVEKYISKEELIDFVRFADNGRNIRAENTYVPNSKPASTENEMVQMIDHHVLIHWGSSKSKPSPIDVKPQLSTEKACYHTPIRVTDDTSDFISLTCGKRPANVSFRVKDDLLELLSPISKTKKEQHLVKLREKVKLHSSLRDSGICSLVKGFFTIWGKILHARSNGSKTFLYILSEPQKEMFEAGTNERNVNDIDLQDKKKHYLQRLTKIPFERLPQPILNRDAIVCFVEGQTHNTFGGSSASPFEHGELREILNSLASDNVPGPQITMKYEMLRLCTMKNFPAGSHPFAIRIIEAGFYYFGNRDEVVCYCCGSRKDNWVLGDIPLFIHQSMFPSCSFLTSNSTVNVPIIKTNSARSAADVHLTGIQTSSGSNQFDTAQGESPLMLLSSEQQQENISSRNHQMLVTNKGSPTNQLMSSGGKNVLDCGQTAAAHMYSMEDPPPMYPQYSSKNMRINSFQGWPVELRHGPDEMAECGFYYAGFGDCVRCFCCGVGLRQWINEDDPWIEHARWSTSCKYVRKRKGEEFVSLVKMAVDIVEREEASQNNGGVNQPHQDNTETALENTVKEDYHNSNSANSTAPKDVTSCTGTPGGAVGGIATPISSPGNAEIQKYLLTDAARSVLDMGYEPKLVLRAIEMVLMKKGSVELTGQVIIEAVFEIEEDTGNSKLPQTSQSEQENKRNTKDSAAAERAITGELAINPEQIVREHTELLDATLCKICLNKTMSIVFLPCGHLVTCPDCAPAMRKCPVCRSLIKGAVKTLFG